MTIRERIRKIKERFFGKSWERSDTEKKEWEAIDQIVWTRGQEVRLHQHYYPMEWIHIKNVGKIVFPAQPPLKSGSNVKLIEVSGNLGFSEPVNVKVRSRYGVKRLIVEKRT